MLKLGITLADPFGPTNRYIFIWHCHILPDRHGKTIRSCYPRGYDLVETKNSSQTTSVFSSPPRGKHIFTCCFGKLMLLAAHFRSESKRWRYDGHRIMVIARQGMRYAIHIWGANTNIASNSGCDTKNRLKKCTTWNGRNYSKIM